MFIEISALNPNRAESAKLSTEIQRFIRVKVERVAAERADDEIPAEICALFINPSTLPRLSRVQIIQAANRKIGSIAPRTICRFMFGSLRRN